MAKTPLTFPMNQFTTPPRYTCIFFDLDHTLWDYETNSLETLLELFELHALSEKGVTSFQHFHTQFKRVNGALWVLYDRGEIGSEVIRQERFKQILASFNVHDRALTQELSQQYLHDCPQKGNLIPGAIETLEYLTTRGYRLSVITNGFEEIQQLKLEAGNLHRFFEHVVTSQQAGHKKPAREIFDYTLRKNEILAHQAVMIGDNLLTDIAGARQAQMDTVFFNPDQIPHQEEVTLEIKHLSDLCHHL
jgi:YjjG family noncanonical pyrimidine nucleotidase